MTIEPDFWSSQLGLADAGSMTFDPAVSSRVIANCESMIGALAGLQATGKALEKVAGCGGFGSSGDTETDLENMASLFQKSLSSMREVVTTIKDAVRAAGKATQQTDDNIKINLDHVAPNGTYSLPSPIPASLVPAGPRPAPNYSRNDAVFTAGRLTATARPESPYSFGLSEIKAGADKVDAKILSDVGRKWLELASDLESILNQFTAGIGAGLGDGKGWSGTGAESIRNGINNFAESGHAMAEQARQAGNTVVRLTEQLGTFQSKVPAAATHDDVKGQINHWKFWSIDHQFDAAVQKENNRRTEIAREAMMGFYVPGIVDTSSSMPKPTQPYNPVVASPSIANAGALGGSGGFAGSGGFDGGIGGSATSAALRNSDAAAAAEQAAKLGASPHAGGVADASSAQAQLADNLSRAAEDSAPGAAGSGGFGGPDADGSSTELASLSPGAMSSGSATSGGATDSAMRGNGALAGATGTGGGAGFASGAAGFAGGGGALSANGLAAEARVSQRAASAESLAAREAAAARAAASGTSGTAGQSGSPIASRAGGAAKSSEKDKTHKPSKLLLSVKNGEEIIGPDPATTPELIDATHGPLNLSYDNDR